ncbi:MAG: DeoR/GlpR transcriptional regulator [Spirochaetales bacterium]|nr:DeoR/GlpR transcriptional regulator [Spirochaetales bacterium]MBR5668043.1 DeoR/GlpR transcriptional regulator [Spirochaetales bacterium]
MLAQERYAAIMKMIRETNIVKIGDIATKLKVSNETARRDLETLQDQKLLKRVHGGAVLIDPITDSEPSQLTFSKAGISIEEKAAIGRAAAEMVRNGETIFLDIGSTTLQIARNLKMRSNLTVITNSIDIINELAGTNVDVIVLGGKLAKDDLHISSPITETMFEYYNVDRSFISCGGISRNGDITDYSDLLLNRKVVRDHSNRLILVADSGKFGKKAMIKACDIKMMDTVITDTNLSEEYRELIIGMGIEFVQTKAGRQ